MKEKTIEKLTEKYKEGTSTLKEEQSLFNQSKDSASAIKKWAVFIKKNKKTVPENINDRLWDSFQKKLQRKQKFNIKVVSIAASVALIVAFYAVSKKEQNELSYKEKEILLNEVQNMFADSENEIINKSIIYEDDQIIIYTNSE